MAFNLQRRGVAIFGKWLVNGGARSSSLPIRRGVHVSIYDKNVDEYIHPTVVPDDLIPPQSDKYWAPDPQTGVFGPASESDHNPATRRERGLHTTTTTTTGEESVLEQKAFFRPLEDLDKPPHP